MPLYEHVFLARQDVTSQQVETMIDTYKGVIEQNGGRLEKIEMWGVKSLAYRIKKNRKGHYMLLGLDCPAAAEQEVARAARRVDHPEALERTFRKRRLQGAVQDELLHELGRLQQGECLLRVVGEVLIQVA